jgi:hypothetical protein
LLLFPAGEVSEMVSFLQRYGALIRGVLSCYNRVVINGTFPDIGHAGAMEGQLRSREIRIFDYTS